MHSPIDLQMTNAVWWFLCFIGYKNIVEKGENKGYQLGGEGVGETGDNWFVNPLPDDKILDESKLKQIADDILKCS